MADLASLQRALALAQQAGATEAAALIEKEIEPLLKADTARTEADNMGFFERGYENVKAGLNNAWQGAQQVGAEFGIGPGVSDQEVRDTRIRNQALADSSDTHTGPPNAPTMGKAVQFVSEAVPGLLVPGGFAGKAALGLARTVLPRVLPRSMALTPAAGRTIANTTGAAVGGGGSAALAPVTSDESRGKNIGWGGGISTLFPLAGAAARYGQQKMITGNAPERLINKMAEDHMRANPGMSYETARRAVTQDAITDIQQLQSNALPTGAQPIPLSTSTMTRNNALGIEERASRALYPDRWHDFDVNQNRAVWNNVEHATQGADDLATREATRRTGWPTREREALAHLDPGVWAQEKTQFRAALDQALQSPSGQNQMRRPILEMIRQMDELGDNFTPAHMTALRTEMSSGVRGRGESVFATAPRADPLYQSVRDEMDRILNGATGNRWQNVLDGYIDESKAVNQAKSMKGIRESFVSPEGVIKAHPLGGVPQVTEAKLRQTVARAGENRFGDQLGPQSRGVLENTMEALNRANFLQDLKNTGTGKGGSNTVMDGAAVARKLGMSAAMDGGVMDLVVHVARQLVKAGRRNEAEQVMYALSDPDRFVQMVQRAQGAGQRISPEMREIALKLTAHTVGTAVGQPER
jgi:hypothetical protein